MGWELQIHHTRRDQPLIFEPPRLRASDVGTLASLAKVSLKLSFAACASAHLIPASISFTRPSIVFGVTTPAPVFSERPGILYFAVITHCTTGMKPCR